MGTGHTRLCGTPHILWLLLGRRGAARAVVSPPGQATGPHLMCVHQGDLSQTSWPPQGLCQPASTRVPADLSWDPCGSLLAVTVGLWHTLPSHSDSFSCPPAARLITASPFVHSCTTRCSQPRLPGPEGGHTSWGSEGTTPLRLWGQRRQGHTGLYSPGQCCMAATVGRPGVWLWLCDLGYQSEPRSTPMGHAYSGVCL